jgi:DNA-directed RNA polymerase specialized sigma24 family protein
MTDERRRGGWSEREIAQMLGCRKATVKSLASRALERLRQEITP